MKGQKGNPYKLRKADLLLGLFFVLSGILCWILLFSSAQDPGAAVEIKKDGVCIAVYSLEEDRILLIDKEGEITELSEEERDTFLLGNWAEAEENLLQISKGEATVIFADCPDQHCAAHRPISQSGETIICLPHKLVITVCSGKERELDAIVG